MTGNNKLVYLYDDTNTPYGYIYNDTPYYYERNAQGDVVGLYYANGIKIANYTYDAWGNILSITNQWGEDITDLPRHQGINNFASALEDKGFLTEYNWRCEFDGWVWVSFS